MLIACIVCYKIWWCQIDIWKCTVIELKTNTRWQGDVDLLQGSDMEAEDEDDYPDIDPTLNPMSEFDDNIMHMEEIFPTGQLPYELLESSIHLSERTCEQNK